MGLKWPQGKTEGGGEATFNNERANKWTDSIIPTENMRTYKLSGTDSQRTDEALSSSTLYVYSPRTDAYIVSGDSSVVATSASLFWPAYLPYYFIPRPEALYIAAIHPLTGCPVQADIAIAECPD